MAGIVGRSCAEHTTLWCTFAVAGWRNEATELLPNPKEGKTEDKNRSSNPTEAAKSSTNEEPKVIQITPSPSYLKVAVSEAAFVCLFVASIVEGVVRCIFVTLQVAYDYACTSMSEHEKQDLNADFQTALQDYLITVPMEIFATLSYNFCEDRLNPADCYDRFQNDQCSCLPHARSVSD